MWVLWTLLVRPNYVNGLKNPQKIGQTNGMHSLPTGPTQVMKTGNMGSVDVFRAAHLFTFGPRGQGNALKRVVNGLKKSAKNRGSQWYDQSANCAQTGHVKGKCRPNYPW